MTNSSEALTLLDRLIAAQVDGEAAVQGVVAGTLADAGCGIETVEYDPGDVVTRGEFADSSRSEAGRRRAVIARLEATAPGARSLLMFAHPDSEEANDTTAWTHSPFRATHAGGRIHGWGVADDLAGCAAAVLAIRRLARDSRPRGALVFASPPSKRHARGVAALLGKGLSADAALYLHPAESGRGMGEIKAMTSSHLEFRVTVTGCPPDTSEPGHTAFSHLAANPVDKAVLIHGALNALSEARAARLRHSLIEAEVGRATNLHVAAIRGGDEANFARIGTHCTLGCGLSFAPGEPLDTVRTEVEEAVRSAAAADPWLKDHPPRIDWLSGVTGAELSREHPLWRVVSSAVERVTGAVPILNPMHSSSDIRVPTVEAGIPCVGLGCLAGDLSQNGHADEWVDAVDYERMVDVTAALAADWCLAAEGR